MNYRRLAATSNSNEIDIRYNKQAHPPSLKKRGKQNSSIKTKKKKMVFDFDLTVVELRRSSTAQCSMLNNLFG